MEVFTEAWCTASCERLNARESYRRAAAGWQGSMVLEMTADAAHGIPRDRTVFLDLHEGGCRAARVATDDDLATATYVLRADAGTWKRLLAGALDPIPAVMQGRLRLARGGLFTLAKYADAAREMVAAAGEAGGTFPDGAA